MSLASFDIKTHVVEALSEDSALSLQEIKAPPGFGTPKGAIFLFAANKAASCESSSAFTNCLASKGAAMGLGFTDGNNQGICSLACEDDVATSECARVQDTSHVIKTLKGDKTVDSRASLSAFITDGVRILWNKAPSEKFTFYVMLIGGEDAKVDVGTFSTTNTIGEEVDVTVGFNPHVILAASVGKNFTSGESNHAQLQFGYGLEQNANNFYSKSHSWYSKSGVSEGDEGAGHIDSVCFTGLLRCFYRKPIVIDSC